MTKSEELRGDARASFDMWRRLGLSEQAAMDALIEDGVITLSEDERQARMFYKVFGLSESEAQRAVDGRDGPSLQPVSEAPRRSSARPEPGDALKLVRKVEELAVDLCHRGVSEEKALREAAFAVFEAAPDDSTQEWVAAVTGRRWPGLWGRPGSGGSGQKGSSSGRTSGTVRG
jgi:hypothetical protein